MDYRDKYLKYKANYMAMKQRGSPIIINEGLPVELNLSVEQIVPKDFDLKNPADRMNYYASYKKTQLPQQNDLISTELEKNEVDK